MASSSVMLSKFYDFLLISLISLMIGSQILEQKRVARIQPRRSPSSHTQQFCRLVKLPLIAYCMERAMVMAGLMTRPASGANDLAMWQKMAMLMQPESQLYMKLVFGFDSNRVNSTRMNTPIVSLDSTLKISSPLFTNNGSKMRCPKTSLQKRPANAPKNCAKIQHGTILALQLLSFLRKLERVMAGLILAPQSDPEKKIAISRAPAAWASTSKEEKEQLYPQAKRKTAANQKPNSWKEVARFIMLNQSCQNRLIVLSLRVRDFSNYYQS